MSRQLSRRQRLSNVIGFCRLIVAPLLLAWLLSRITTEQWALLNNDLDLHFVPVAILIMAVALTLNFYRWRILLRGENIIVDFGTVFRFGCIGYASGFLSIGSLGGDVLKATLLARNHQGNGKQVFLATAMDRIIGLYALSILTTAAFFIAKTATSLSLPPVLVAFSWAAMLIAILGGVALHLLTAFADRRDQTITQSSLKSPETQKPAGIGWRTKRSERRASIISAVLISLLSQSMVVGDVYLVARLINPATTIPELLEHFLIVPFCLLAAAVPISPGGIGVFEASLQWMYTLVCTTTIPPSGTFVGLAYNFGKITLAGVALVLSILLRPAKGSLTNRTNSRCENQYLDT